MEPLKGKIIFESVAPNDLPDAARSLGGTGRNDIKISAPGVGVDELLGWSLKEVQLARDARDTSDQHRCATNSLLNGRRALACLVEWYLRRDYFSFCADAPQRAEDKAELLQKRGILDATAASALRTAIVERDKAEHQFAAATLQDAESFVETMRSTIARLRSQSDPSLRPFLFGRMSYSLSVGEHGQSAQFFGWLGPSFLFCFLDKKPWLGAVVPDGHDPATAIVRRTFFDEVTAELLLQVLQILEGTFGQSQGSTSVDGATLLLRECGVASESS